MNRKKIARIISAVWVAIGVVLLVVVLTVGANNEQLQPAISRVLRVYGLLLIPHILIVNLIRKPFSASTIFEKTVYIIAAVWWLLALGMRLFQIAIPQAFLFRFTQWFIPLGLILFFPVTVLVLFLRWRPKKDQPEE